MSWCHFSSTDGSLVQNFLCFTAKAHPKIEITPPAKCPDVTDLIKKLAKDVENSTNQVIQEVKNQMAKEAKEFGKIAKELKNIKKKVDVQLTKKLEDIRQLILKDKGETPKNTTVPPTVEESKSMYINLVETSISL